MELLGGGKTFLTHAISLRGQVQAAEAKGQKTKAATTNGRGEATGGQTALGGQSREQTHYSEILPRHHEQNALQRMHQPMLAAKRD